MKKIAALFMSALLAFGLMACGNTQGDSSIQQNENAQAVSQADETTSSVDTSVPEKEDMETEGKILVVYFSVPETDSPNNMNIEEENSTVVVAGEVLGNTQYVAYLIQENLGSDIFRIEPVTPYPVNHAELETVAKLESSDNVLPEISTEIESFDQYQTIFIGYPIWYADMPRILYTLFDTYDFSGKTIVPFITSGASGFFGTLNTIQELEPDAKVITDGYSITRNHMEDAETEVAEWLSNLSY